MSRLALGLRSGDILLVLSLQQEVPPLSKGYAIVVYAIGVWRCMAYLPWRQAKHLGLHGGNVAPVVSFGA